MRHVIVLASAIVATALVWTSAWTPLHADALPGNEAQAARSGSPLEALLVQATSAAETAAWGEVIAALEQARSLAPTDRSISLALREARRESRKKRLEAAPDVPLLQGEPTSIRPLRAFSLVSDTTWAFFGLICLWSLIAVLLLRRSQPPRLSRTTTQLAVGLLVVLLCFPLAGLVGAPAYRDFVRPALLVEPTPAPTVAPDEDAPAAALPGLYPGTVVRVLDARDSWRHIVFANGERAWVQVGALRQLDPRQPPL